MTVTNTFTTIATTTCRHQPLPIHQMRLPSHQPSIPRGACSMPPPRRRARLRPPPSRNGRNSAHGKRRYGGRSSGGGGGGECWYKLRVALVVLSWGSEAGKEGWREGGRRRGGRLYHCSEVRRQRADAMAVGTLGQHCSNTRRTHYFLPTGATPEQDYFVATLQSPANCSLPPITVSRQLQSPAPPRLPRPPLTHPLATPPPSPLMKCHSSIHSRSR